MNIINLLISLFSGVAGGNIAGAAVKDSGFKALGNSILGAVGGGLSGIIMQALGLFNQSGGAGVDFSSVISNVGAGGVGGAILMFIATWIKKALQKNNP